MRLPYPAFLLFFSWGCTSDKDADDTGDAQQACRNIVVDPTSLTIEGRLDGAVASELTISNGCAADGSLTLTDWTVNAADGVFTLDTEAALPLVLAPGASEVVSVAYRAAGYATASGALLLTSDDPDSPTLEVALSGTLNPDQDGDGHDAVEAGGDDCDDQDDEAYPGGQDPWYDGRDTDCAGNNDYDADHDGYTSGAYGGDDCDDSSASTNPGAPEIPYNDNDDACDGGNDNDLDGDRHPSTRVGGDDCNDADADVYPGADDAWYDGLDSNCDGENDFDQDGDGSSSDAYGGQDCDDLDATIGPDVDEIWYDGFDQDCDGADDYDQDGDGYQAEVAGGDDCDDTEATVWPGNTEDWDGLDNDCDGYADLEYLDAGALIITELHINPKAVADNAGEYIEVYNTTAVDLNLKNWLVADAGDGSFVVDGSLVVPAGGYAVIGVSGDTAENGGVVVDYAYGTDTGLTLDNSGSESLVFSADGLVVTELSYDDTWSYTTGVAMGLDPDQVDSGATDSPDVWCAQASALPSGDLGTPGVANDLCPQLDHDGDGLSADEGDCDDTDGATYPGADEIYYDGADGDCAGGSDYDADTDGFDSDAYGGHDCDDADPDAHPGADEVYYDGADGDCDGGSDYDADADGYDAADYGGDDCDDTTPSAYPGGDEAWYDGVDGDCDGGSDYDADADGYDAAAYGGDDCDDADPGISPDASEGWDGQDSDCDGTGDEEVIDDVAAATVDGSSGDLLTYATGLSAGDLDGDGAWDVVLGGVFAAGAGGAWVLAGEEAGSWSGEAGDLAWASVAGDGDGNGLGALGPWQADLTGDGVADLVVGGTDVSVGSALCVWDGAALGLDRGCSDALFTATGADDEDSRVVSHLDLDGDGLADVVYSDLIYGSGDKGRVYVVGGDTVATAGSLDLAVDADARVVSTTADAHLGSALMGADLNGDGLDDLLIGAEGMGTSNQGALYLLSGAALDGVVDVDDAALVKLKGGSADARLGASRPALGDLDADGVMDLAVGEPGDERVAIYLDTAGLKGSLDTDDADVELLGAGAQGFGTGLAAGDLDGDGAQELAVGAPDGATPGAGGSGEGEVTLYSGLYAGSWSSAAAGALLHSASMGESFGGVLLSGLDLDGDGQDELLIGAWNNGDATADAGRAYLLSLP